MQKIKDILRLKYDAKLPLRQIALSLSLSLGAVSKYLKNGLRRRACFGRCRRICPTIN